MPAVRSQLTPSGATALDSAHPTRAIEPAAMPANNPTAPSPLIQARLSQDSIRAVRAARSHCASRSARRSRARFEAAEPVQQGSGEGSAVAARAPKRSARAGPAIAGTEGDLRTDRCQQLLRRGEQPGQLRPGQGVKRLPPDRAPAELMDYPTTADRVHPPSSPMPGLTRHPLTATTRGAGDRANAMEQRGLQQRAVALGEVPPANKISRTVRPGPAVGPGQWAGASSAHAPSPA